MYQDFQRLSNIYIYIYIYIFSFNGAQLVFTNISNSLTYAEANIIRLHSYKHLFFCGPRPYASALKQNV